MQQLNQSMWTIGLHASSFASGDETMKDLLARDAFVKALDNSRVEDEAREKNQPHWNRHWPRALKKLEVLYNLASAATGNAEELANYSDKIK